MWHAYVGQTLLWRADPLHRKSEPHARPAAQQYRQYAPRTVPPPAPPAPTGLSRSQQTLSLPEPPSFPRQPDPVQRHYRLRAHDQVLAQLTVARDGTGDGQAADLHWHFVPHGALARQVEIFAVSRHTTSAPGMLTRPAYTTLSETGDGALPLSADETLYWVREAVSFPRVTWRWQSAAGEPLLRYTLGSSLAAEQGALLLLPPLYSATAPSRQQAAPLLVLLGWYLLVQRARRTRQAVGQR